jgi:integrase
VLPTGVKSYFFRYRNADGDERRSTIGKHGSVTPDEARKLADDLRRRVVAGSDPVRERREHREAATVGQILDAYLDSEAFKEKAQSTRMTDEGRIKRHLLPLLGRHHVDSLTPNDIKKAAAAIRDGKTAVTEKMGPRALARVRGGEGVARKCLRLLRAIFVWAVREKLIDQNPAEHIQTGSDGSRELILEDAEGYARLFNSLDRLEHEQQIRSAAADAIRFIALTGCRRSEATRLKWSYVNLKAGEVKIPVKSHKTGGKTGKPRVIGLPAAAHAIIARQPAGEPDDLVFQPAKGIGVISLQKPWLAVHKAADLPQGLGLHGLRHSTASHMAMAGAEASQIMQALGHRNLATSQKYVHWAKNARQALAEKAAAVALAGMNFASTGNVVALKGKAQ